MRKMLMRMCLEICSPGGPWALEVNTATGDAITGATLEYVTGVLRSPDRWGASICTSEAVLAFLRECTAQCEHGAVGWPKANVLGSGLEAGSCCIESISVCPISSCDISLSESCVLHEAFADWRCGHSAPTRKVPPWLKSKAAMTVVAKNRLCIVIGSFMLKSCCGA